MLLDLTQLQVMDVPKPHPEDTAGGQFVLPDN